MIADNVECFFAWWGNLLPNTQDQTGTEFGLQARLDAARAVAAQKAAADDVFRWVGVAQPAPPLVKPVPR